MQCKPYVVEDISNGLEKQPVRAVNYWNHKEVCLLVFSCLKFLFKIKK